MQLSLTACTDTQHMHAHAAGDSVRQQDVAVVLADLSLTACTGA